MPVIRRQASEDPDEFLDRISNESPEYYRREHWRPHQACTVRTRDYAHHQTAVDSLAESLSRFIES